MNNIKYNNIPVRKRFSQNFLRDEKVLNDIAEKADLSKNDFLLEIGPGNGELTEKVLPKVKKLVAAEIDRDRIEVLKKKFSEDELKIFAGDVLKLNIDEIPFQDFPLENRKVIGNIPYNITTPIIMKFIDEDNLKKNGISKTTQNFSEIIILLQKEVADRIVAKPGTKSYGALSVILQYACEVEHLLFVSKNCFYPKPKVDSAVIRLKLKTEDKYNIKNPEIFWRLVKAVFISRRKTLRNSLKIGNFTKEQIESLEQKVDLKLRGETFDIEMFANVSNMIN